MNLVEAVAKRIKQLLKLNNISEYALRKKTCLSEKTLTFMFKGKTKDVKLSTIRVVAEAFDMSLKEFFDDEVFKYENIDYWCFLLILFFRFKLRQNFAYY